MDTSIGETAKGSWIPFLRQCFLTASVAINIVGHGCVIGYPAILIPELRKPNSSFHATPSQESWIASIVGFALILGNIIITPMMDILGRKRSLIITTIPALVGWFLLLLANSVSGFIIARFLQGVSMGMVGPLGSIVIGEMTDPKNRGAFLTSVALSLTAGVSVTHALGAYFSTHQTTLACSFITFTSLLLIIYAPESPPWLISKGRFEEASEVFFWLRGRSKHQENELEKMVIAQKNRRQSSLRENELTFKTHWMHFFRQLKRVYRRPEFYKPVIIMFHMYTMFQFAGINVISSYAMDIIKNMVGAEANAKVIMVALDMERLLCNILAVFLMKTVKRRTLLFTSAGICIAAYLLKGLYIYAKRNDALPYDSPWIPVTLLVTYMFSLAIGIAPIPFAISGEIFPLSSRGLGGGLSVMALSLNFFIAVKCFPVLTEAVGISLTYGLYAGVMIYCLSVIWFMLPETKGRTLQEIEDSFKGLSPDDKKSTEPLNYNPEVEMLRRCSSTIIA